MLGEYGGQSPSVILYSLNLTGVTLLGFAMSFDATRAGLTTIDAESHHDSIVRAAWIASVFLLSIPVAALVDAGVAQLLWLVLFLDPTKRLTRKLTGSDG